MIHHPYIFATINIFCAATAVIGGILGISAFLYIRKNKEFIEFLVLHFQEAINKRKKNDRNNHGSKRNHH